MLEGPEAEDGITWVIILAQFWKERGADPKSLSQYIKNWYSDSNTIELLNGHDIDVFTISGCEATDTITCQTLQSYPSFRTGCNKIICPLFVEKKAPRIDVPKIAVEGIRAQSGFVDFVLFAKELIRKLNIKRLPGGHLAVYARGIYVTEDADIIVDRVASEILGNDLTTKLRVNLFLHIRALADAVVWGDFELYPHLLCCPNCVVDLTSGQALEHSPVYMMLHKTRVPYRPKASRELWEKVIDDIVLDVDVKALNSHIKASQMDYYQPKRDLVCMTSSVLI